MINRFDANEVRENLDIFKGEISLPKLESPDKIESILQDLSNHMALKRLDPIALNEYAVLLGIYSTYLTMEMNRYITQRNWCDANLQHIIGRELDNVEGYGYQEKSHKIVSLHPEASKLDEKKLLIQTKIDYISGIAQKLQFMCDMLKNLAYSKSKQGDYS